MVGVAETAKLDTSSGFPIPIEHGFLYSLGRMYDLNDLLVDKKGWEIISAQDINDKGQIACVGKRKYTTRALLLTPAAK